jgi:hypothetical protein
MLCLWVKNFWYLIALTPFLAIPFVLVNYLESDTQNSHDAAGFIFLFIVVVMEYVIEVIVAVAILGLLRKETLGKTAWAAAWKTVKIYTWPVLRLFILFALIIFLFALAIFMFGIMLGIEKDFVLISFCVFAFLTSILFALSPPLIVAENLNATAALKRSWKMCKIHFWYLTGCLFFLLLGDSLLYAGMTWVLDGIPWSVIPLAFTEKLFGAMWMILTWCMYLRIKEIEAQQSAATLAPTSYPT